MGEGATFRKPILVTEDEAIIAMEFQAELSELGYDVAGPFATCAAATEWLRSNTPAFAVLDVELRDGPCTDVAVELRRRGVRFAVFSGVGRHELPPAFADAPWFEKPADMKRLVATLAAEIPGAHAR